MAKEYIERQRAIVDACNSLELYPSEYAELENALNRIPAADVAPVVLCKDCKWYSELVCGEGELLGSQGWCNEVMARPMPSNGFCSFGERKKGHGQTNGIQNGI